MGKNLLLAGTIIVGLTSVSVSLIFGNKETLYIKPLFHLFLFALYYVSTRKFNRTLVVFLGSAMVGEAFISQGFEEYYIWVMIPFTIFFSTGIYLLKPVLVSTKFKLNPSELIIPGIVGLVLLYAVASIYILAMDRIPELLFYGAAVLVFCLFIASCFYITLFNKHPKNIFIFVVAIGYIVVCLGAMVYELIFNSLVILGIVNLCEIIAQLSFVLYMIHLKEVLQKKTWHI